MSENLCLVQCSHGGLCTLPARHSGDHKALFRAADPDGGSYCSWPDELTSADVPLVHGHRQDETCGQCLT